MVKENIFDKKLKKLDEDLTRMGELCEIAIAEATKALIEGNTDQARAVIEADEEIDQMEKDIERLCLRLLLQQQPVAKDLRKISSALKMITDMERIGDQTSNIAEIVLTFKNEDTVDIKGIGTMAEATSRMVRHSIKAYVDNDLEMARYVMEEDDKIDKFFEKVRSNVADYIQNNNVENAEWIFDIIMVAKYLERIGDHATNIAEWVEFSITGVHRAGQS
ncbi:Phosphate transport system protein phoU homolog [Peptostreptococcus anaerobius]|jgi:phosphate transport system protein|uniref:Phosphate-specific transport system accessory protein PhoU n=2 Tax=Peptostreptococcus anaerobius TaxID=1261 RepID=A0A135YR67_9FIRM|nr:phosphate signaling complex protein PhoU [Peptostreptococcus anaerobius]EKX88476.1 phosphate transport system regulatory protein PhoU [Peptostreptococcus anaerobius VPI 4330 = DSM 2949]KXI11853.1 phosphate transport system regulatory protein PhoU [Peptostreptococcus anaerobius]MDB8852634.1 phosphate signaling complex protein PhoU [Peptostreptococcus anaerobius]MDK8278755.1 phosphate signaling complex protein PhoU [Peptostreptococcus anaerobius]MDU5096099.1 phosphate signaling complex protei